MADREEGYFMGRLRREVLRSALTPGLSPHPVFDRAISCDERFKSNGFLKSGTEIITVPVVQLESAILMTSRLFTLLQ